MVRLEVLVVYTTAYSQVYTHLMVYLYSHYKFTITMVSLCTVTEGLGWQEEEVRFVISVYAGQSDDNYFLVKDKQKKQTEKFSSRADFSLISGAASPCRAVGSEYSDIEVTFATFFDEEETIKQENHKSGVLCKVQDKEP